VNINSYFNVGNKTLQLEYPLVMGIINLTPDSFYEPSRQTSIDLAATKATEMWKEGASMIDLGGVSSRPGSNPPSVEEELKRVIPVIEKIKKVAPEIVISVDTFRSEVASHAIASGASLINDISSGSLDERMVQTIAHLDVPYIAMHMQGTPASMQLNPTYTNVVEEVIQYFFDLKSRLNNFGIHQLIFDPGFGFGKSIAHNYQLLYSLHAFQILNTPILTGISRKSMVYKLLECSPDETLIPSSALHWEALRQGTQILRVHDVKPTVDLINLFNKTKEFIIN